ncbi:hypothetical protein IWQ62_003128 [Dispira parvispora]|uniref:Ribosomal protein S11 n=1 Tax=Dispira parvispora TaxID=1520584 RepID=A0A9W8E7C2_9FUNG|nr:hypothetical protein IWQ62_003128 [Dispira parvispora]
MLSFGARSTFLRLGCSNSFAALPKQPRLAASLSTSTSWRNNPISSNPSQTTVNPLPNVTRPEGSISADKTSEQDSLPQTFTNRRPLTEQLKSTLSPHVLNLTSGFLDNMEDLEDTSFHMLHVHAGLNNTILSLTNEKGVVLINTSGGSAGFKKSKRAGFEAAYQATQQLVTRAQERGINVHTLQVKFKGFGQGRDATFKALRALTNWRINRITDCTPIPFNGCRPKKQRRL